MHETIQNIAGGAVDDLFLALPRIINRFRPVAADRSRYEKEIDYYYEHGYVDDPLRFFSFPETVPAWKVVESRPLREGRREIISFQSGYVPRNPLIRERFESWERNKTGYIVRWTHGDTGRKTVLCLHGYMLGEPVQAEGMFRIHGLFSTGLDVALFITPFHWKRGHKSLSQRAIFLEPENAAMTWERFGQTMFDLHASFQILRKAGAADIGIIGASLGGYNGALFSALTDIHSFAALMVPAVDFSRPLGPRSLRPCLKKDDPLLKKIDRIWAIHSPLNFRPKLPPEKMLIIASQGDRLCPSEHVISLRDRWGITRCHLLPGGHWLVFNNVRGREWYRFLEDMGFVSSNPPRS